MEMYESKVEQLELLMVKEEEMEKGACASHNSDTILTTKYSER